MQVNIKFCVSAGHANKFYHIFTQSMTAHTASHCLEEQHDAVSL